MAKMQELELETNTQEITHLLSLSDTCCSLITACPAEFDHQAVMLSCISLSGHSSAVRLFS